MSPAPGVTGRVDGGKPCYFRRPQSVRAGDVVPAPIDPVENTLAALTVPAATIEVPA